MIKQQELTDPKSCISKAHDDEMIFVLLARDWATPATIIFWIQERIRIGKNKIDDQQIKEALALVAEIAADDVLICPYCRLGIRGATELKEGDLCPASCIPTHCEISR
jgi:hypothetical protein